MSFCQPIADYPKTMQASFRLNTGRHSCHKSTDCNPAYASCGFYTGQSQPVEKSAMTCEKHDNMLYSKVWLLWFLRLKSYRS